MKYNNILNKVMGVALAALSLTACTDTWNDHYDAANGLNGGVDATLWQTISTDQQFSNFAKVVKACGYDKALNSSQMFTVFAPTNSNFTLEEADKLIETYNAEKAAGIIERDNSTVKEFIHNHIALYNYSVSSNSNDSIVMMNGKYSVLTNNTFGGQQLEKANVLHNNGVLFTLSNKVDYFPNVFEYLRTDSDLDSVANFLHGFSIYEFDASQSVPGGIVNGQTVYLDSVFVLQNELFYQIGRINSEDSTYWMVAPTNEVWKTLVDEYSNYFIYAPEKGESEVAKRERDSLTYHMPRMAVVYGTVFSRTNNSDAAIQDSALSVNATPYQYREQTYGFDDVAYYQYLKPFAPGGVFYGTENITTSNGQVMKAATWNINKLQTFYQSIKIEAENIYNQKEDTTNVTTIDPLATVRVSSSNPFYNKVSGNTYVEIAPIGPAAMPYAKFYLPNTYSNIPYDVYAVIAPAIAGDTLASEYQRKPNKIRVELEYTKADGTDAKTEVLVSSKETRPDVMDTILIKSGLTLPACSYGLTGDKKPKAALKISNRATNAEANTRKTHTKTIRVDCLILRPQGLN